MKQSKTNNPPIHKKPLQGPFNSDAATLAGGTAIVQMVFVLALPVLTRIYSVAEFGDLVLYQSVLSTLLAISALKYDVAILVEKNDLIAIDTMALSMAVVLIGTLLVAVIVLVFSELDLIPSSARFIVHSWWLLSLGQLGAGGYTILTQWALRRNNFKTIARTRITQTVLQIATQICLGVLKSHSIGLLIGDTIGRTSGLASFTRQIWCNERILLRHISVRGMISSARKYRGFAKYSSVAAFIEVITDTLPAIMLATIYGNQVAGWYGLIYRVLSAPNRLIAKSISEVYSADFAMLARTDPFRLKHLFVSTLLKLAAIAFIPMLLIMIVGPYLVVLVFGDMWTEAGIYARYLAILILIEFSCYPFLKTLNLLEKQHLQLMWHVILFVLVIAGLWLASILGYSPSLAILYFAGVSSVMYIAYVWKSFSIIKELCNQYVPSQIIA